MRIVRAFLLLLVFSVLFVGNGCGVGTTAADTMRQTARVADYDARMLVDDVSLFIMTDRPMRGSYYAIP
ncbi:MAG: hypothetical protein L6Q92_05955 [Phycisphaerae bacterium]|nr:hypothetical protein [Phycisphaerae bacterium]